MEITEEKLQRMLISGGFLKAVDLKRAESLAEQKKISLAEAVEDLGFLSDAEIGALIADELEMPFVDLSKEHVDQNVLLMLPEKTARAARAVVCRKEEEGFWLASDKIPSYEFLMLLRKRFKAPFQPVYATSAGVDEALKGYERDFMEQARELAVNMSRHSHEEDVVKLVDLILSSAHKNRASDIHIEPEEETVIVRFRIDGSMHEMLRYAPQFHEKVVFRIKILSRLRTDEHMQAQDGRFEVKTPNGPLNLRVSILPITHGENVVMRLLSERFQRLRLEDLGFQEDDLAKVKHAAQMPHGMILAAGPTGSGKTTTLYGVIHILNQPDVNLMTIEDPVEYDIEGIRQIQVNPRTNLTFEQGLRSIVRQDPDVIMVGEIRDSQTADIAVNAALTGHLLLSTLHANDAATAFPRLFEMQVEPFLIASSVNVVIAQRLVRRICPSCIQSYTPEKDEQEAVKGDRNLLTIVMAASGEKDLKKLRLYRGRGCPACGGTGYTGRMGIYEIMEIGEELRPLIVNKTNSSEIRQKAIVLGMRTMVEDGMVKVFKGQTTLEEIIRATKA